MVLIHWVGIWPCDNRLESVIVDNLIYITCDKFDQKTKIVLQPTHVRECERQIFRISIEAKRNTMKRTTKAKKKQLRLIETN